MDKNALKEHSKARVQLPAEVVQALDAIKQLEEPTYLACLQLLIEEARGRLPSSNGQPMNSQIIILADSSGNPDTAIMSYRAYAEDQSVLLQHYRQIAFTGNPETLPSSESDWEEAMAMLRST